MKNKMTGDFVYEALISELSHWIDNCDSDKYNLLYDYIYVIAYEQGVSSDCTPAGIVDNLVVNGDYAYEGDSRYDDLLESGDYAFKGDGIILVG